MIRLARYEVFRGLNDNWYWRLLGGNGETICVSEGYSTKYNCVRGAKRARALSRFAMIKDVTKTQ
jgi:uncharacterized protein YegP (UPF0339 family)